MLYAKFGSAMGRVVIWYQSLSLIAQHGVFGSGIGSFCGEYGETLRLFFSEQSHVDAFAAYADVVDYAFCDILQVGVEQGWIGLLLALLIVALVLRSERGTSKGMFACMYGGIFSDRCFPCSWAGFYCLACTANLHNYPFSHFIDYPC